MRCASYPVSRLGLLLVSALLGMASGGGLRAETFTVDSAQSSITLSGTALGFSFQEQGTGSLTAHYGGTILATVTGTNISFTGSSQILALTNGTWQPDANGASGSAPADYGGQASAFVSQAKAAVRDLQLDVTSGAIPVTNGQFDSSSLVFQIPLNSSSALDYQVTGLAATQGRISLAGLATNAVATTATLVTSGTTQTLTIPIHAGYQFTMLTSNDLELLLSGQLVATRTVTTGGQTFAAYIAAQFPGVTDPTVIGPTADPDHDGLPNFVEFAFGLNASVANPGFAPLTVRVDPTQPAQRTLEYVRPQGLSGVSYQLESSSDLKTWTPLTATPQVKDLGNGQEQVTVTDTEPLGANASRFIRLTVSQP